jgi:hypothetical protein
MLQPRLSWGGRGLRTTLWACLLSATATLAWAQTAAKDGPVLYFKQNQACLSAPNCQIPASPVFPNPNDYTTLATLTLPPGDYLVTSKLSAFAAGGTSYVNFECALLDLANPAPLDYSSFDGWAEQTLFLQTRLERQHRCDFGRADQAGVPVKRRHAESAVHARARVVRLARTDAGCTGVIIPAGLVAAGTREMARSC